jgi:HSP20 family molecular chaperone IbpA
MSEVNVQKVNEGEKHRSPVFEELGRRLDAVRQRAFELFESRGGGFGQELEDWFRAEKEIFGGHHAELTENPQNYEVRLELKGFEPKDIHVTATANEIVVHAVNVQEEKDEQHSSYSSSDLLRRFGLENAIDPDQVKASLNHGLLTVEAAKVGAAATPEASAEAGGAA